jgi:hypothetical protein
LSPRDEIFGGRVVEVDGVVVIVVNSVLEANGNGSGDDVGVLIGAKADFKPGKREGRKELKSRPGLDVSVVWEGGGGVLVGSLTGWGIVGVTVIVDMMVVAGAMLITRGLSPPILVLAAMVVAFLALVVSV